MLSLILPVYQVENYLKQAVTCLLNQDIEDFEIILVDDGSTDTSSQICDDFAKKYDNIFTVHQKNSGVSSARNKGLDIAKGEYIAFLDPDDFVDDDYYNQMLTAINNTDSDIVFSKYKRFYEKSGKYELVDETDFEMLNRAPADLLLFFSNTLPDNNQNALMGYVWRSIFKKSIIDKNNIRFNENIAFSEDLLFLLEYLSNTDTCCTIENYGYNYRIRSDSATAVSYKKDLYKTRKECLKCFGKIISSSKSTDENSKKELIDRIKYISAKEIIYNEMRFCKNAVKTLNTCCNDGFLNLFLSSESLKQAERDNIGKLNLLILNLAKKRLFAPIKLLYSIKYREESL